MRFSAVATSRYLPSCRPTSTGTAARVFAAAVVGVALLGCNGRIGGSASTGLPTGSAGPINPGRVVAHRLNNVEYDNTVRDLVGLDLAPSRTYGFPEDGYVQG